MADNGSRTKPEELILYEKDPKTKIATITFNRPEYLNAPTSAARLLYADLLRAAWEQLAGTADGAGVALVTQYLFHTDPRYDSGLCETAESGGARRPAFDAWRSLPSFA